MKKIFSYLLALLIFLLTLWVVNSKNITPDWVQNLGVLADCILLGGIGGILYCLRAIYINACVRKNWDSEWAPWYYIRPIVSLLSGGISWLFLKAGLLVLDSTPASDPNYLGFLALAFIAGYNVDKFLGKIEQVSEATFGISVSKSSTINAQNKEKGA